jgi:hypothetical protein
LQRFAQDGGGAKDGIAFGHGFIIARPSNDTYSSRASNPLG